MSNQRLTSAVILVQALVILGLLYWLLRESEANPFMRQWLSQTIPQFSFLLNRGLLFISMGIVLFLAGAWILLSGWKPELAPAQSVQVQRERPAPAVPLYEVVVVPAKMVSQESRPFYETMDTPKFLLILALVAQATSLWFITAALLKITSFPPDSLAYARQLPVAYWWGLLATLLLVACGTLVRGKTRTGLELCSLFLLALYLIGLPSFVYENPRIIDSYQHMGNSLGLLNNKGWIEAPIWYLRQFPGAYTFFAQLASVAGIDPFALAKYYVVGFSWTVTLFIYVIVRSYSPRYSAPASALFLGGIWFQLHLSPQSLGVLFYLGILFVSLRMIDDHQKAKIWAALGIIGAACFVTSHPITPLVTIAGSLAFFVLTGLVAPGLGPRGIAQTLAKSIDRMRLAEILLAAQALLVLGLLYIMQLESSTNVLFSAWVSENSTVINVVVAVSLMALAGIWALVVKLEKARRETRRKMGILTEAALLRRLLAFGAFVVFLSTFTLVWWQTFAAETSGRVERLSERALELGASRLTEGISTIPATPAPTYSVTITVEQAISVTVWTLGLFLLLFLKRSTVGEFLLAGFFVGGISTIPLALFGKSDLLQRSYLFALIPGTVLLGFMMARRPPFIFRGRSLLRVFRAAFLLAIVFFSFLMPIARNGVDPFEYIPGSSLHASEIAAGLEDHSILFIHSGEYGWRFYAASRGDTRGPRLEQPTMAALSGGFVKMNSTLDEFDLNFTTADASADYIMISDFYENLYILRFGAASDKYLDGKAYFEAETARRFNLVYSTGTDRIYANGHSD